MQNSGTPPGAPEQPASQFKRSSPAWAADIDWSRSSLGDPAQWSPELITAVHLSLECAFPVLVLLGPELIVVANEHCLNIPPAKDTVCVGHPCADAWPELWKMLGNLIHTVCSDGRTRFVRNHPVLIGDTEEECYFNVSLAALTMSSGERQGVICTLHETTPTMVAERRFETIRQLAVEPAQHDLKEAAERIITIINSDANELPFAFLYADENGTARVLASTGLPYGDLGEEDQAVAEVMRLQEPREITGDWGRRSERALIQPLQFAGPPGNAALVFGMRKCHEDTEIYRDYLAVLTTLAAHILGLVHASRNAELIADQNAELERSNEELQRFAFTASHDLQEPLRTVIAFTQLLARRNTGKLSSDDDQSISLILEAANRMSKLISGLLEYSKVAEFPTVNRSPVDMTSVLKSVLANLSFAIQDSRAQLTFSELPVVGGDESLLGQLLQNLISNAIRYRKPDEAPHIHIAAYGRSGEWLFEVADNGLGFRQEYAEVIFGMFKRIHGRKYSGTGIGLSICRKIVERHGGRIWAESQENAGSKFSFTLPS